MKKMAKDLSMGDTIMVASYRGKSERIIDRVQDGPDGTVKVTLYTESGKRPVLLLARELEVETVR